MRMLKPDSACEQSNQDVRSSNTLEEYFVVGRL